MPAGEALGEDAAAAKQLLIKRVNGRQALFGELAPFHTNDIQAFEAGMQAADEAERNHVAAHAANAADHHLRSDPRELVHRRQPADEDEIADLAMAAERG